MPAHIPDRMQAVVAPQSGGPEVLAFEERPVPTPGPREVLVRVAAAGVNRPDVMQRMGNYPPPPGVGDVFGLEMAGEVVAVGAEARRFAIGDRVCGLVPAGGYAKYAVVDERNALRVPDNVSPVTAGAIPETFFTVWTNMIQRGQLQAGEWLLVHGGSSGIGTTAIQIAHARGAKVAITAGSEEKCERCRALGADLAINYRETDFVAALAEGTGGHGFDLCLDMVAGEYVNRNLEAAAPFGRIVQIALQSGPQATIDMSRIMLKKLWLTGSTLRPRSVEEKGLIASELEAEVAPLWAKGRCLPVIDSTYAFADVVDAHRRMDEAHIGKVILVMEQ